MEAEKNERLVDIRLTWLRFKQGENTLNWLKRKRNRLKPIDVK